MLDSISIEVDRVGVQTHAPIILVSPFFLRNAFFGRGWAEKSGTLSFLLTPGVFHDVCPRARQVQVVSSSFLA